MKSIYLLLLPLILCVSSCQQRKPETIVLCFEHYNPQSYKTPGGMSHMPMPKVLYIDSAGTLIDYTPHIDFDTITLYSSEKSKELGLSYRNFEYVYYPLMQGDTITVSMDSLDYPLLKSKHHPERDRIYNMNYGLRKGNTHLGLEAKTWLGSSFVTIAKNIDYIRKHKWDNFLIDYCPLDSLQGMFSHYKKAYIATINSYKQQQGISNETYDHYKYLLQLKEYESQRMLNKDTLFYRQMEANIADKDACYPSYREYLDYYLWYFSYHIKTIGVTQGNYEDWTQTFDELASKSFEPKSKHILLERCIKEIGNNFPAEDLNKYLAKYLKITQDTLLYNKIRVQYNLSADANQLWLKDINGNSINFQQLLSQNRGKVLYVDFWASHCGPCRVEMAPSSKLRERYKGKNIIFLYLAYNDTEAGWKKAVKKEGLSGVKTNYFITNSKNSRVLSKIKLDLIPRYIIFGKKGNIVEMNAPRPSERRTVAVIDKYL